MTIDSDGLTDGRVDLVRHLRRLAFNERRHAV